MKRHYKGPARGLGDPIESWGLLRNTKRKKEVKSVNFIEGHGRESICGK